MIITRPIRTRDSPLACVCIVVACEFRMCMHCIQLAMHVDIVYCSILISHLHVCFIVALAKSLVVGPNLITHMSFTTIYLSILSIYVCIIPG
jgi:hypothetical protein